MFARVVALAFLSLCLAEPGRGDGHAAQKRPYEVPRYKLEAGFYLLTRRSLYDEARHGVSIPVAWTGYRSDSLDWKFEGWVSYTSTRGNGWISAVAAPGFTYWVDGATAVTPYARIGFAHDQAWAKSFAIYGADVLVERSFALRPGAPHHEHRFVMLDWRIGFLVHQGIGPRADSFGELFVNAGLSYDWPLLTGSWDERHRKRAKLTLGVENRFGGGAVDRLYFAALSLRSEGVAMGEPIRKLDLSLGIDRRGRHRVLVGFMHGF